MIRFALIAASTLGFFLTAALGNFMAPLLRAFGPGQEPEAPQTSQLQPDSDPDDLPPPATPTMGGLCLMVGTLAAVGVGWTAACVAEPALLGDEGLWTTRLLIALFGALAFGAVGLAALPPGWYCPALVTASWACWPPSCGGCSSSALPRAPGWPMERTAWSAGARSSGCWALWEP